MICVGFHRKIIYLNTVRAHTSYVTARKYFGKLAILKQTVQGKVNRD